MKLLALVLAYGAATLAHHVHNAEFVHAYPNMPAWLTAAHVYAAWAAMSAVGVLGYAFRKHLAGLVCLAIYAILGFYGLAHYLVAPMSAHTLTMHLTIWAEVLTALLLLVAVTRQIGTDPI